MTQKQEKVLSVGTMGLLASVFGNLAQAGENNGLRARNDSLKRGEAALRSLLTDWQQAYQEIDAQLSQAMRLNAELHRTNDELVAQVADLRRARDHARAEAYEAGRLAMELQTLVAAHEAEQRGARREVEERKTGALAADAREKGLGESVATGSARKRASSQPERRKATKPKRGRNT